MLTAGWFEEVKRCRERERESEGEKTQTKMKIVVFFEKKTKNNTQKGKGLKRQETMKNLWRKKKQMTKFVGIILK